MTDKQIIIDYKNLCENYSEEIGCYGTFDGSCIKEQCFTYKLLQQLQAKEQECEEFKKIINEAKNSKLDLNSFFAIEATVGGYQLELDQLKTENKRFKETIDELFKVQYKLADNNKKLRQCLTEIKEIAEFYNNSNMDNICYQDGIYEILQKISEYEVE